MTLRHKLADWISGGALTRERHLKNEWYRALDEERRRANFASGELCGLQSKDAKNGGLIAMWGQKAADRGAALQSIIACETPGANATVKRMARIAREALK